MTPSGNPVDNVSEQDEPRECAYRIDVLLMIQEAEAVAPVPTHARVALIASLIESILDCDTERSA